MVTHGAASSFEVLIEQECQSYAAGQKLALHDIKRLAIPLDLPVREVVPVVKTVERDRVCQHVRAIAPCKPRLAVLRQYLAAPLVGRNVAQYVPSERLWVPPICKFFDQAIVPSGMQFHVSIATQEILTLRLPTVRDVEIVST